MAETWHTMRRTWLIRWLVILSMAAVVAAGVLLYLHFLPTELENSIHGDLLVAGRIDESATVTVLKNVQLFDAASHRLDYATVCIRDNSGYRLAHLRRLAQHAQDSGGRWSGNHLDRQSYDRWPTAEEIEQFDAGGQGYLKGMVARGWLPRRADQINFRARRLSIQVSEPMAGFDPNAGIDAAKFAAAMTGDHDVAGRPPLGQLDPFTLAPFHKPRWFAAKDGLKAVEDCVGLFTTLHERAKNESELTAIEQDLEMLHAVKHALETVEARGRKFHFLASDE